MFYSVVAVMCVAFWPVGKRSTLLQFGWIFLGGIAFLACAVAVFMTFVTLSGGFPICNGYVTLLGNSESLYAHPNIIPAPTADIYKECLYNYGASINGKGSVVEGVVIRGSSDSTVNETTWGDVSASLLEIQRSFVSFFSLKNEGLYSGSVPYTSTLLQKVTF